MTDDSGIVLENQRKRPKPMARQVITILKTNNTIGVEYTTMVHV